MSVTGFPSLHYIVLYWNLGISRNKGISLWEFVSNSNLKQVSANASRLHDDDAVTVTPKLPTCPSRCEQRWMLSVINRWRSSTVDSTWLRPLSSTTGDCLRISARLNIYIINSRLPLQTSAVNKYKLDVLFQVNDSRLLHSQMSNSGHVRSLNTQLVCWLDSRPTRTLYCKQWDWWECTDGWKWTEIEHVSYLCDSGACWTNGQQVCDIN